MGAICLQKHNLHPVTMTDLISFHKKRAAVDTTILPLLVCPIHQICLSPMENLSNLHCQLK